MNLLEIRNAIMGGKTIFDLPLKVAYYARVSTDKYEQLNSLENQVKYYEEFIRENKNWIYVDGYIDEGISGTSTNKRESFKKMIRDAEKGKFNLIITKEISRFARDTLDSIKYTRELLANGVGVLFQYDHINTFDGEAELRLTIMASIAQEEVRKLSERTKFGFQRSIEKGVVLGNSKMWGYTKNKGKLVIDENEQEIVKRIFEMYVNEHIGMRNIGLKLYEDGICNHQGGPFSQGTIKYILTNPKYKGYYCGNKSRTVDYHTKKRVQIDEAEWKLYEDYENVPPIISESMWEKAQEIIRERTGAIKDKTVYQNRYPFSGKIWCMKHGRTYRRRVQKSSGIKKKTIVTWRCAEFLLKGIKSCDGPSLYDEELKEIVSKVILKYVADINIVDELIEEYKKIEESTDYTKEIEKRKEEIERLERAKSKILELIIKELITEKDFKSQSDDIVKKINTLKSEIIELSDKSKSIMNSHKYLEMVRKKALEKFEYEKADVDSLIWEFLKKIEVYDGEEDTIKLNVILSTGESDSILFNPRKHHFCTIDTYV